jgi:hypothetical protein
MIANRDEFGSRRNKAADKLNSVVVASWPFTPFRPPFATLHIVQERADWKINQVADLLLRRCYPVVGAGNDLPSLQVNCHKVRRKPKTPAVLSVVEL